MSCQRNSESAEKTFQECIATLKAYKSLSESPKTHSALLQERTPLLYPATLLEEENTTIVALSLDILHNLIYNHENHSTILSTFGVYEALESLSLKKRNRTSALSKRAEELVDLLRSSAPPAYSTRSRSRIHNRKENIVLLLEIEDLKKSNKRSLERALVKTRGVISFLVDEERRRCTIRLCQNTNIKCVVQKIFDKCGLKAMVVTRDRKTGGDLLRNVLDSEETIEDYYDEEESSPGNKAIIKTYNFIKKGNGLLKSVADFWNESFYW